MLTRWHYLALLAPMILLVLEWRRPRGLVVIVLFLAILFASGQALADMRVRDMRERSIAPITSLSPRNPLRQRFSLLHGIASMLLVAQIVLAGVAVGVSESSTES